MANSVDILVNGKNLIGVSPVKSDLPLTVRLEKSEENGNKLSIVSSQKRVLYEATGKEVDFSVAGPSLPLEGRTSVMAGATLRITTKETS